MQTLLSQRVQQIEPSPTLAISDLARTLKCQGKDIISLSAGEPDFDTPDFIKAAAIQAIHSGYTKYTPVDGLPELKEAIAHKLMRDNQLTYHPTNEILVSSGAKESIYHALMAIINPHDEVIIPAPYWVSYPSMAILAEAKPVVIATDITQSFKFSAEQLSAVITDRSRALILNSPSNPSGQVYSKQELEALAAVLIKHPNIIIISDDIYEHILFGNQPFINILNICPELCRQTIIVNGASKAFAMTGWRIGYAAGPAPLIQAMKKLQSQSTTCACAISQKATQAALEADPHYETYQTMTNAYQKRHDLIFNLLNEIPGITCAPSHGTFYTFPDVSQGIRSLGFQSDIELSTHLLEKAQIPIAVVPGTAFGSPGHIRISYATNETQLMRAAESLKAVFSHIDSRHPHR